MQEIDKKTIAKVPTVNNQQKTQETNREQTQRINHKKHNEKIETNQNKQENKEKEERQINGIEHLQEERKEEVEHQEQPPFIDPEIKNPNEQKIIKEDDKKTELPLQNKEIP